MVKVWAIGITIPTGPECKEMLMIDPDPFTPIARMEKRHP